MSLCDAESLLIRGELRPSASESPPKRQVTACSSPQATYEMPTWTLDRNQ
jgi:hypothetical protein